MQTLEYTKDEILHNIELTRKEMISKGETYGYTKPVTIKESEKLDELLNIYQIFL
jgi:hypothetical protein